MVVGLTHRAPSERAPALADWDVLSYRIIYCDRVCTSFEITDSRFRIYVGSCVKPIPTRDNRDTFRDSMQSSVRLANFKLRYSTDRSIDIWDWRRYINRIEITNFSNEIVFIKNPNVDYLNKICKKDIIHF